MIYVCNAVASEQHEDTFNPQIIFSEKGSLFFFFNSVLRPVQDYFSSYETGQSVGRRKRENPEKNHLAHPQAELGLSHMWSVRGSNPHQTQWRDDRVIKKQRS